MGVMGRTRSLCDFDFSRRFDGDKSSSRLGAFRFVSGERVTTVARLLREGVSGTANPVPLASPPTERFSPKNERDDCSRSSLYPCEMRLGISEGIVGKLWSAKFIVLRKDGLGSGEADVEVDSMLRSNMPDSYSFTKIWFAGRILRGTRFARPERLQDDRREMGATGSGGGSGPELVEAAKFWRASSTTPAGSLVTDAHTYKADALTLNVLDPERHPVHLLLLFRSFVIFYDRHTSVNNHNP